MASGDFEVRSYTVDRPAVVIVLALEETTAKMILTVRNAEEAKRLDDWLQRNPELFELYARANDLAPTRGERPAALSAALPAKDAETT